jgi:hypothetical protein
MESETNFQQPSGRISNNNKDNNNAGFIRNNSIKNSNSQQRQHQQHPKSFNARRRASDCSFYGGVGGETGDNISYYGVPLDSAGGGRKRGSLNGVTDRLRRSHSNKSSLSSSSSSGDVSTHSGSSSCSADDTTTSSGQPNLPFPGLSNTLSST